MVDDDIANDLLEEEGGVDEPEELEDVDEESLAVDDDLLDDDIEPSADGDQDVDVDDDDDTATPTAVEDEEEDEEDEDEDEVEASLDVILKEKLVVADEEDEDEAPEHDDRVETGVKVLPRQADEFVCTSCFLVKHPSQLADAERMLCRDCV